MIGNLLERATQDLRALKMSKWADRPPLTAASPDPSPAVGYGIPVAMPTSQDRSARADLEVLPDTVSVALVVDVLLWCSVNCR